MKSYLIMTHATDGRLLSVFDAVCPSERAALEWAKSTLVANACAEVWADGRCLARVNREHLVLVDDLLSRPEAREGLVVTVEHRRAPRLSLFRAG